MKYLIMVAVAILLVACGQTEEEQGAVDHIEQLSPIEVELLYEEALASGENMTFDVLVTQNEAPVEDAREVIVEFWQEGAKEESDMIESTNEGGGVYRVTYEFPEDGLYFVQPHVTARDMHRMPLYELTIGEEAADQEKQSFVEYESEIIDLSLFAEDSIQAGEETTLLIVVEHKDKPFTGGVLTLEIWQHEDEAHTWLDTEETDVGQYEVSHTFANAGEYHVVFHIEDDTGLHEHIHEALIVDENT
ncbi:FixH family protein [Halalkalibacterium halodurans]|uniref:FixH family protein n=1 Tax=Halalkalibacterium halodurans TaxID=86665 RepID=UPI0010FF3326|nr:FixH family protein [Halalkalibacterium halodurans]